MLRVLLPLCGCAALTAQAQPSSTSHPLRPGYVHESWTIVNGLPVNGVNALLQSREGYIWAATWDGLVRFDGVRFTVYNAANSPELWSSRLVGIHEARDSSLWLRAEWGHLIRFRHGRVTRIGERYGIAGGTLTLADDASGALLVGGWDGLWRIEGDHVERAAGLEPIAIYSIAPRADGTAWLGTNQPGVHRFAGGAIEKLHTGTALDTANVHSVLTDSWDRVWLTTSAGLWLHAGDFRPILFDGKPVVDVVRVMHSSEHRLVYAFTGRGVLRIGRSLDATRDGRIILKRDEHAVIDVAGAIWHVSGSRLYRDGELAYDATGQPDAFGGEAITQIAADREGSVWVGTATAGLHRVKPALFRTLSEPEGLAHRNTYAVYEDGARRVWIAGLEGGISRVDTTGRITRYDPRDGYPPSATSFFSDRADRLWVGTGTGLLTCSLPALRCARESAVPEGVSALFGDSLGRLWVGSSRGAATLDNGRWRRHPDLPVRTPIRAFAQSPDGAIWMGSAGEGLVRYDGSYTRVTEADGLPSDLIRALHVDADGWLWVGTEGRGLARLDPRAWSAAAGGAQRRIVRIGAAHGLFDEAIHQILEDGGRLWMNTNRGVFWVSRADLIAFADGRATQVHSTSYNERDGIRNREGNGGNQPAGIKARDGRLWFPTQDGVVIVDPTRITANRVPPPVVIERVVAGDSAYVPAGAGLRLGTTQRDLQIDFTALSFLEPGNVRFRYQLTPYDADWIEADNRRTAFYTRVPPGRYTFRVIASNNDGVWNEAGATLDLSLAFRPWETTAFRMLVFFTLGAALAMLVRWRGHRLRMRALALERVVDERTQELQTRERQLATQNEQLEQQALQLQELDRAKSNFFTNVSHELRTPLTLTIGPLEDLQAVLPGDRAGARRSLDMALRNARRLLRLVNQILDVAKLDAAQMKLRPQPLDLVPFIRGITAAFDAVAGARGITLTVDSPTSIPGAFDPDAIEKIVTNLLSNAVKFSTDGGCVGVTLRPQGQQVTLTVSDTGPGIPASHLPHVFDRFYQVDETNTRAQPGTGIGLSLVKELVKLHGGTIDVTSGAASGAVFTVTLPRQMARAAGANTADDEVARGGGADVDADAGMSSDDADAATDAPCLLIVDDSSDMRAYIRDHFADRFRVLEAATGEAALEVVRDTLPDVIVSDVMMPGVDGHELVRRLRANAETDFIPIILLTAQAATEHRIAGLQGGADDFVTKPFDMRELAARVDNVIATRRLLRERSAHAGVTLPADPPEANPDDRAFLDRVRAAIEQHLGDEEFGVTELARAVFQDRSHLYRRLRELTGETPSELLRRVRLERAAQLLSGGSGTVADVAYATGFRSVSYFTRAFHQHFGTTPAAWRDRALRS